MNYLTQEQADALIDAAMRGVRQIKGTFEDEFGGRCAIGAMFPSGESMYTPVAACPFCGATQTWTGVATSMGQAPPSSEMLTLPLRDVTALVIHLNNDHEWDFLTIARKLGPDGADHA